MSRHVSCFLEKLASVEEEIEEKTCVQVGDFGDGGHVDF